MSDIVVGIDEAGRGPWAGPLTAAAVAMEVSTDITGLDDSKKLSPAKRERLYREITRRAVSIGVGWSDQARLDEDGLQPATAIAMHSALDQLSISPERIIIDGSINYLVDAHGSEAVAGADGLVPSVSAASIVAKHLRDNYMRNLAMIYPQYGFDKHKGYGTASHKQALERYGVCHLHRRSFTPVKAYLGS